MTGPASTQRWIALLLFVVAPIVLAVLAAANGLQALELGRRTNELSFQVARYRDHVKVGGPGRIEDTDLSPVFVNARSRSLAEAELQRKVVAMIENASGRVIESGAGEVPEAEAGDVVDIRATLDTENAGLLRFLYAVETGLPLMTVEALTARRLENEDAVVVEDTHLRIDVTVRAHWRQSAP